MKRLARIGFMFAKVIFQSRSRRHGNNSKNSFLMRKEFPHAPELAWAYTTYKEVRKEELFEPKMYLRTSSVAADGSRVYAFTKTKWLYGTDTCEYEFDVGCGDDGCSDDNLAVSSVRK